ncbi:unnamed protein product [Rotaria sordida]|uniref:Nuclear receptor domain-containing protein n=1 Tax=Rotaria sordida TaxID=392033 RepID=A0A819XQK7_9BILA|nr:unnamed protein product [Rotaria sordida]
MNFKRPLSLSPIHHRFSKTHIEFNKNKCCQVCGDKANIFNYGALSCASCKTFFRRHGFHPEDIPQCDFYGNCEITIQSRRMCTACRFSKCLAIGMSPDLIRKEDFTGKSRSLIKPKQQYMCLSKLGTSNTIFSTMNLLSRDISSLSPDNWILLSNLVHAFDSFAPSYEVKRMIKFLTTTSVDIQYKLQQSLNIVSMICQSIQSSINSTADFRIMTTEEQCSLVQRNTLGIWAFYSMVILYHCDMFDNISSKSIMNPLYKLDDVEYTRSLTMRLDPDPTLVKLIIMVLSFSSNCFTIHADQNMQRDSLLMGTFRLLGSQNAYVEIMWKYMLYRYGYFESAKRFCELIKIMLDEINMASNIYDNNKIHQNLANQIIEGTKRSLTFDGSENIPLWGKNEI